MKTTLVRKIGSSGHLLITPAFRTGETRSQNGGGCTVISRKVRGLWRALLSAVLLAGVCLARQSPRTAEPGTSNSTTMRSVEGVVTGPKGEPVPDAVVLLKDNKTLQVRSFITDKDGTYHFYGLSKDISYELRAEHGKEFSGSKTVSSFNDHAKIKVNLKLKS